MDKAEPSLSNLWRDETGATAIEYALVAALISVAVIAGASALGVNIGAVFDSISASITAAVGGGGGGGGPLPGPGGPLP